MYQIFLSQQVGLTVKYDARFLSENARTIGNVNVLLLLIFTITTDN